MVGTKDLGDLGEKIAEKFLKNNGYKVLDKNFRYRNFGELDIIAQKGNDIIFFEVKTRKVTGLSDFLPEDNITSEKQRKLIKLAEIYLNKSNLISKSWQIDILAIEIYRDGTYDIRHAENAVEDIN